MPTSRTPRLRFGIILPVVAQLAAYLGLVWLDRTQGTLTHSQIPRTASLYFLAFGAYLISLRQLEKRRITGLWTILGSALLFRLVLLATIPTLSSDVYRYLWDGHVANNGVSPYLLPIDSNDLDYLDIPIRAKANHVWMASPYLPAAQWLFGGVTAFLPTEPFSMQLTMVTIDLLNGGLLLFLLGLCALPARRAAIYLWNPLVVLETAHGAHVDVWMIFLTLAAVALAYRKESGRFAGVTLWISPVLLALATLTKLLPGLLSPVFFWRWGWWQRILFGVTLFIVLAPYGLTSGWGLAGPLDGRGLFAALRIYGDQWNFNSGLFHWLESGLAQGERWGLEVRQANQVAKRVVAFSMVLVLGFTWWRARADKTVRNALRLMALPLAAYVLLTPTFHPWYLLLLLAFTPFLSPAEDEEGQRWLAVAPWIYLSGALFLSYFTYVDPLDLREFAWVRRTEWLPTWGLLIAGATLLVWHGVGSRRASAAGNDV